MPRRGPDKDEKKRRLAQLLIAASDITAALHACDYTIDRRLTNFLYRALVDSLVVNYAKPFLDNKGWRLPREWWPKRPDHRRLHRELLKLRNEGVAHSQREVRQAIVEFRKPEQGIPGRMIEKSGANRITLKRECLPAISRLCLTLLDKLNESILELESDLFDFADIAADRIEITP